jgi:hemoglobin
MKKTVSSHVVTVIITLMVVGGFILAGTFVHAQSQTSKSSYARLGGYDVIAAVTDDFIARVTTDPRLASAFAGQSQNSLRRMRQLLVDQLCEATGGPCYYIRDDMNAALQGPGLTEADWNITVKHLDESLDKFKVGDQERTDLFLALGKIKADMVEH